MCDDEYSLCRYDDLGRRKGGEKDTGGSSWGKSSWDTGENNSSSWKTAGASDDFFEDQLMSSKPKDEYRYKLVLITYHATQYCMVTPSSPTVDLSLHSTTLRCRFSLQDRSQSQG